MSNINYTTHLSRRSNDSASQVLREAAEYFEGEHIHMNTADGIKDIISNASLFEAYVGKISEGLEADDAENFAQLMENTRAQLLQESSISNIAQVSALSMPVIRKMWPKIGVKNAIPTEAVKQPKFSISYLTPYIRKQDGTKVMLPEGIRNGGASNQLNKRALGVTPINLPAAGVDLIATVVGASVEAHDSIDPNFAIVKVNLTKDDLSTFEAPCFVKLDGAGRLFGAVTGTDDDDETVSDTLTGALDRRTGELTLVSVAGKVASVVVQGTLTDENNNHGDSVHFQMDLKEVQIGTGVHLNAPLPIEFLQDVRAAYSIDGALKVVDIMSNLQAQKIDQDILDFLEKSFVASGSPYTGTFNCHPSGKYTGSPTEWRNELRTMIDHFANKMKKNSSFYSGTFVVIASPVDAMLIPNVDWTFSSVESERGGVEVNYNIGAFSGTNRYVIVSSDQVADGTMRIIFIPNMADLMTYKYYPYAFNVQNDYRDPSMPNVPNIMITRRDTVQELTPLACVITIQNNNGTLPA